MNDRTNNYQIWNRQLKKDRNQDYTHFVGSKTWMEIIAAICTIDTTRLMKRLLVVHLNERL